MCNYILITMFFSVIPVRVYFTFLTSSNKQQIFPEVKKKKSKTKNQKRKLSQKLILCIIIPYLLSFPLGTFCLLFFMVKALILHELFYFSGITLRIL